MDRLLIVGAGGFSREVLAWATDIARERKTWEIGGFLIEKGLTDQDHVNGVPVLGDPFVYLISEGDCFVCAVGDSKLRMHIVEKLKRRNARFATLIHPSAVVGPGCSIGEGCILCPGVVVTTNVTLGDFIILNVHSSVGHDAVLGDFCTISGHCDITGGAVLGKRVFMGTHATVLPKAKVGDDAVVGAGSVALRTVRSGTTVMGVPAKMISGFD